MLYSSDITPISISIVTSMRKHESGEAEKKHFLMERGYSKHHIVTPKLGETLWPREKMPPNKNIIILILDIDPS